MKNIYKYLKKKLFLFAWLSLVSYLYQFIFKMWFKLMKIFNINTARGLFQKLYSGYFSTKEFSLLRLSFCSIDWQ